MSYADTNTTCTIDNKIEQCKKDITALQDVLKQLEDQKEKEKKKLLVPKHGDVVEYIGIKRIIIENRDGFTAYDRYGTIQAGPFSQRTVEQMYNETINPYHLCYNIFTTK